MKFNFIFSRCFETSVENSYIIFEDLTMHGYANNEKKNGLTVKHYELIFKKLAKWHATNAILLLQVINKTVFKIKSKK